MKQSMIGATAILLFFSCQNLPSTQNASTADSSAMRNDTSLQSSTHELVPGPIPGTVMTKEYVYQMGRQMYFWGWPLVNLHNRLAVMKKVPEPGLNGGAVPVAPAGQLCMLSDYITPDQRYVACPNQDVVYGSSFLDLSREPTIIQIPDFDKRFWVCQMGNQRTDGIGKLGAMYGSRKGFYLIAGPSWKEEMPKGVEAVFTSNTNLAYALPRVFMNSNDSDRKAIQPIISQIMAYPLSQYDGTWKTKDWTKIPHFPDPNKSEGGKEVSFVIPEKFFEELPVIMEECPPLKGEEMMYLRYTYILDAASKDPILKTALNKAAVDAEKELIDPLRQFKNVGVPVGNHWHTTKNGAAFGTDYLNRTGAARSNIFVNQPNETIYFNQDLDSSGNDLNGINRYTVTFSREQIPAVKGFWSLTVYDANHFFYQNSYKVYSIGTKNRNLQFNPDGSLTIYLQNSKPPAEKVSNWIPAPPAKFGLLLRAYWPEESMLLGYIPPAVVKQRSAMTTSDNAIDY